MFTDQFITISDVARELNIKPSVARAKLRELGFKPISGRWHFLKTKIEVIKSLLR